MLPLNEWEFVHENMNENVKYTAIKTMLNDDWSLDDAYKHAYSHIMESKWFDTYSNKYLKTLCIGHYNNEEMAAEVYMNGHEIMFAYTDAYCFRHRVFNVSDIPLLDHDMQANDGQYQAADLIDYISDSQSHSEVKEHVLACTKKLDLANLELDD